MPDVREVYEMVTKQKAPGPGALERQQKRQARTARNRRFGALAAAAAIGLVAVVVFAATRATEDTTSIADEPIGTAATSREVATGFIDAFGAFDADTAVGYLAEGASLTGITTLGDPAMSGSIRDFRTTVAWFEAIGYKQTVGDCELITPAADALFSCPVTYDTLRSDETGVGPYVGSSWEITVRDGAIVRTVLNFEYEGNGFSETSWEPFGRWVSDTHPEDAAVMYTDDTMSLPHLTQRTIRLWEERTKEYVKEVQAGTA
jgi:hypothetical protein